MTARRDVNGPRRYASLVAFTVLALAAIQRHAAHATPILSMLPLEPRTLSGAVTAVPGVVAVRAWVAPRDMAATEAAAPVQSFSFIVIVRGVGGIDTFALTTRGASGSHPVTEEPVRTHASGSGGRIRQVQPERLQVGGSSIHPLIGPLIGINDAGLFYRPAVAGTSVFTGAFGGHDRVSGRRASVSGSELKPESAIQLANRAVSDLMERKSVMPGASVFTAGMQLAHAAGPSKVRDLPLMGLQRLLLKSPESGSAEDQRGVEAFAVGELVVQLPFEVIATLGPLNSTLTSFLEFNALP